MAEADNVGIVPLTLIHYGRDSGLDLSPFVLDGARMSVVRESMDDLSDLQTQELVLAHNSVSRLHAAIDWTPDGFILRDTASKNGTFVNEFRLGAFPVKAGDSLRFGELVFTAREYNPATDARRRGRERRARETATPGVAPRSADRRGVHSTERYWLQPDYRRSIPDFGVCAFGVVLVQDYVQIRKGLSEIGQERIEVAISNLVAHRLDSQTHAFRELEHGVLRIVLVTRVAALIEERTRALAADLRRPLAEVSLRSPVITCSTSMLDPELANRKAVEIMPAAGHETLIEGSELRWVHVSDLHFGAGSVAWRLDHEQVMTSLIRDLDLDRFAPHRVFVTGDIAFSGTAEQYDLALVALSRLAATVGLSPAGIRVVPGNHDVDRKVAGTALSAALHRHARSSPTALDEMLADARARSILAEKTARFQAFVGALDRHPPEPDWRERLRLGNRVIDLWGLSSVWSSDHLDGLGEHDEFMPNLTVAKSQYNELARLTVPAAINLILTHHPMEWISTTHGKWLRSAFASSPSVHLCGHVHAHAGGAALQLGKQNNRVTLVAGAAHTDEIGGVSHSYSRGILRCDQFGRWQLGWSPRLYDPERDAFRLDRGCHDLDAEGFAWFEFPNPITARI